MNRSAGSCVMVGQIVDRKESNMTEETLYQRLGGVNAIDIP
jgi:hypothetical protein